MGQYEEAISRSFNESNNSLDVLVGDQTTPPVEYFLTQEINSVTINGTSGARTRDITLVAGHGFLIGEFIEIYSEEDLGGGVLFKRFAQLRVVATAATSITVGQYIGFDLDPANVLFSIRTTGDLSVDGSVTSQMFSMGPPNGFKWDLTRTIGQMILTSQPDDALFGNISALTNGVFFGFENDITQDYLVNIFSNAGFRATAYDVNYAVRSGGGGDWGLTYRKSFAGPDKYGVAIRLDGLTNDKFVVYIQDNLTSITEFGIKIMGHIVED